MTPPVPAGITRLVRVILSLVAVFGTLIGAVVAVFGAYLYRSHRFRVDTLAAIVPVSAEADERARFERDVEDRLFASDFDGLDRVARELRASRAAFSTGERKLSRFYDVFGERGDRTEPVDRKAVRERTLAWVQARPESVTARLAMAEVLLARTGSAEDDEDDEEEVAARWGGMAEESLAAASTLAETCPHAFAVALRLGLTEDWISEDERDVFEAAIGADPSYQPYYDLHLLSAHPRHGAPAGAWSAAARAIAAMPHGAARVARAMWQRNVRASSGRNASDWPMVRDGFREIVAAYPDSLEAKSAFLLFASEYRDAAETRRLLGEVGYRMDVGLWVSRDRFLRARRWAIFEQDEKQRLPMRWLARD